MRNRTLTTLISCLLGIAALSGVVSAQGSGQRPPAPANGQPSTPKPTGGQPSKPKPTKGNPSPIIPDRIEPTTPKPTGGQLIVPPPAGGIPKGSPPSEGRPSTPKPTIGEPAYPAPATGMPTGPKPTVGKPSTPPPTKGQPGPAPEGGIPQGNPPSEGRPSSPKPTVGKPSSPMPTEGMPNGPKPTEGVPSKPKPAEAQPGPKPEHGYPKGAPPTEGKPNSAPPGAAVRVKVALQTVSQEELEALVAQGYSMGDILTADKASAKGAGAAATLLERHAAGEPWKQILQGVTGSPLTAGQLRSLLSNPKNTALRSLAQEVADEAGVSLEEMLAHMGDEFTLSDMRNAASIASATDLSLSEVLELKRAHATWGDVVKQLAASE